MMMRKFTFLLVGAAIGAASMALTTQTKFFSAEAAPRHDSLCTRR